jgi:hypothetical protein
MKSLFIILSLLLIGCYTIPPVNRTPVSSMSDSKLEAEYLNLSSEIRTLERELYIRGYQSDPATIIARPSVFSYGVNAGVSASRNSDRNKRLEHLRLLERRLNEVQLERSKRSSSGLGGYP